jgi:hypothetical protein
MRASNFSFFIERAHLKCFSGHDLKPCKPQGRHERISSVSITTESSESGPNPKAGTVEQNIEVKGALTAEAKCCGAESFTKFIAASFISAADYKKENLPLRFNEY